MRNRRISLFLAGFHSFIQEGKDIRWLGKGHHHISWWALSANGHLSENSWCFFRPLFPVGFIQVWRKEGCPSSIQVEARESIISIGFVSCLLNAFSFFFSPLRLYTYIRAPLFSPLGIPGYHRVKTLSNRFHPWAMIYVLLLLMGISVHAESRAS